MRVLESRARSVLVLALFSIVASCAAEDRPAAVTTDEAKATPAPNILIIIADDLGYSDIEPFGGEIRTPNLNALAVDGVRLKNFYASPTCSPTRAMLLSGTDNHPVGLATMPGHLSANQAGLPGYEMHLNSRAASVATRLSTLGYNTVFAGKWHIGSAPEHWPGERGFDRYFALLEGGGSHFSDRMGPTSKFSKATYVKNGALVEKLPADFYSSTFYTDQTIEFIGEGLGAGEPFFAIVGYTAPHWPLQVPDEYLGLYEGRYDLGYQAIASRRESRMRSLGLIGSSANTAKGDIGSWQDLSSDERRREARRMEIYASMVSHMDEQIGRLFNYLELVGEYDNTLIIFMSDNGAEGKSPLGLHDNVNWIPDNFDLTEDNMGKPGSFAWTGPNWARVSSTPYRGVKASVYEGGIRVPFIASFADGDFAQGSSAAVASISDLAPTILELAGLDPAVRSHDEEIPITGVSLLPVLRGDANAVHGPDREFGWEILGAHGVRKGDWKLVWGGEQWQLFNLADDPSERLDLSQSHPGILTEMIVVWDAYADENGVVLPSENVTY